MSELAVIGIAISIIIGWLIGRAIVRRKKAPTKPGNFVETLPPF